MSLLESRLTCLEVKLENVVNTQMQLMEKVIEKLDVRASASDDELQKIIRLVGQVIEKLGVLARAPEHGGRTWAHPEASPEDCCGVCGMCLQGKGSGKYGEGEFFRQAVLHRQNQEHDADSKGKGKGKGSEHGKGPQQ